MNDNLPAIPERPTREITVTDTDSWAEMMQPVVWLADRIAGTEFVPKGLRGSAPAVAAAILYGREVGLPPMTALTQIYVVEGKPTMAAEAMRALVLSQGHQIEFLEATGAVCRMRARRAGSDTWTELAWTIDMARAAGLLGKNNWKGYPRAMLTARCSADLCRMVFPDVIHGFRSVEEMDDLGSADVEPAEIQTGPTTKVARKRAAAKKATPAAPPALEQGDRPPARSGPPLPGEDGYDTAAPAPVPVEEVQAAEGAASDSTADVAGDSDQGASSTAFPGPEEQPDAEVHPIGPRPPSAAQLRMLMGSFSRLELAGPDERDTRISILCDLVGRKVESSKDLSGVEASRAIDTLAKVKDLPGLVELLEATANVEPPEDES